MIRTIIWFIYFFGYLLFASPVYLYCSHQVKKGNREKVQPLIDRMVENWARRLIWVAGGKVEVTGKENIPDGPAVFVANHQGNFDIPMVLTQLDKPHALIAKASLAKVPGLHGWMNLLECLFLVREDDKQAVRVLMDGTRYVKAGHSLIIFPEGTRSKGGEMHEFKGGAFRIATQSKVPIVPITIEGTYHMLEEPKRIHPAQVYITIHPPIETAGMSRPEVRALPERVKEQIVSAMTHDKK